MKLNLLENGIDSLKFGIEFYDKYLRINDKYDTYTNPGYLKMAVICFHNCLELFSKKLLSNENELLIYKELTNTMLLNLLKDKKSTDMSLEDYMIFDKFNILTIDYTECIKRVGIIFNLSKGQVQTLESMGQLRNKVTHFGLDKTMDFHEVMIAINRALALIIDFYYEYLKPTVNIKHPLDSVYGDILDLMEIAEIEEFEYWNEYFEHEFREIRSIFYSLDENEEFRTALSEKGYIYEIELGRYSHSANISFSLFNEQENLYREIGSANIPKFNSTLFAGSLRNGPIHFVIDLSKKILGEKDCYIYHEPKEHDGFESEEYKFWEDDMLKKKCYRSYFNEEVLIKIIKKIIS
ncbi:hypothetical protein [Bacillus tuaregi]|uniref:hypothetical protein n=1 Tax=Bacillus tuaregi TaxID=1816695 RepID=UPI0008F869F1|nr:hypothetical protein [Bacillus tuaregi]